MAKKLLIVADDFGAHDVIDNGIRTVIRSGNVDCVDSFVTHWQSKERLERLMEEFENEITQGKLHLGLHLTLTCGTPLCTYEPYFSDLTEDYEENGRVYKVFKHNEQIAAVSNIYQIQQTHYESLLEELDKQVQEFTRITGFKPAHLSSHLGVFQANSKIYNSVVEYCNDKGLQMRCPTLLGLNDYRDWHKDPKQKFFTKHIKKVPNGKSIWYWMDDHINPVFLKDKERGLKSTDYFIEHFFRNAKEYYLNKILDKVQDHEDKSDGSDTVFEMVIHPVDFSHTDHLVSIPPGIHRIYHKMYQRRLEMRILKDYNLDVELSNRGIQRHNLRDNSPV